MKLVFASLMSLGLTLFSLSASASAFSCSADGGKWMLSFETDAMGDLVPASVKANILGVDKVVTAKQFMNQDNALYLVGSLGPDATYADLGFILTISHPADSDPGMYKGNVNGYSVTAPGARTIDKAAEKQVECMVK